MKKLYLLGCGIFLFALFATSNLFGQSSLNASTVAGGSGGSGAGSRLLYGNRGIFLDAAGNLYVADHFNNRVQKFLAGSSTGTTVAPLSSTLQTSPGDIFVDAAGNLYVSDDLGSRILKYSPGDADGKVIIQAAPVSPNSSATFNAPLGISVDDAGNVYVTDGSLNRIYKFAPSPSIIFTQGEIISSSTFTTSRYDDVFRDAAGNLYAADAQGNKILKFEAGTNTASIVAGGNGTGSAPNQLNHPEGVFVDAAGNIYIADQANNRVQKWAPGAQSGMTVAGGNGVGAALNQLSSPWSVEVDKAGSIYVSDFGNARVQKFTPDNGLSFKYYEGSWSGLPDFSTLLPVNAGITPNVNIGIRTPGRDDNFAFLWEGYIKISIPGTYTFETVSDDGSKLYFNTPYSATATPLVDNDGLHAPNSATGTVYISQPGVYPIAISYFEKDGGEQMQAIWSGPGIERQIIPNVVFTQLPPTAVPPPPAGNLNYKYYEGGFNTLPDFSTLTPVKTGTSSNFDLGIRRAGVNDSFAIVWDGFINIPTAGTYTFETISDDGSKLYFNGAALVNNDSTHPPKSAYGTIDIPSAGRYPIKVEYFENYGAESFQVYWTGPGITRQLIPDPAFGAPVAPPATGLNYKYYQGDFNTLPDFDVLPPLRTGITNNVDISQRNPGVDDHFAFLWQGYINLPAAGTYTFETVSDDGSKVYFNSLYSANGAALVNNDGLHPAVSATGTVTVFAAGSYPITIVYFEKDGGQSMQLYYSGPGISRQLIPDAVFSPTGTPPAANGGLGYKYYEGDYNVLPDFNTLTPVKTGVSSNVDISVRTAGRDDHFAFLWQGYVNIPIAGVYTFETVSDDGSKLYFNTMYNPSAIPTVNNDGLHAASSATGTVNIAAAGWYPITISYFEKDGGESMLAYWTGPGIPRQVIPNSAFSQTAPGAIATVPDLNNAAVSALSKESPAVTSIYPNPFRESFNIEFYNSSASNKVQVGVYDLKGRLIYMKNAGSVPVGNVILQVKPDGNLLPGGVYMARLQINGLPFKMMKLVKFK